MGWTYSRAGVDIEKGDMAVKGLLDQLRNTFNNRPGMIMLDIGHYGNLIDIGNKALVLCTDGVGTKVLVAQMANRYDTIGIDVIAMNVNDAICLGAEPIAMVDYLAVEKLNECTLKEIGKGLVEGAEEAGIAIIGGETAILSEIIKGYDKKGFDLAGTCLAIINKDRIIDGSKIEPGDALIGLKSSGIHSNGLTLARKLLIPTLGLNGDIGDGESVEDALLKPTKIYVKSVLDLMRRVDVRGLAHITGGGLLNLKRLKRGIGFRIKDWPEIPQIFKKIKEIGKINDEEMFKTFNMGIGFCVVVSQEDVDNALQILKDCDPMVIGNAIESNGIDIRITDKKI
jgi:phosphoribosylformylglycinamidine cyclo-ligase (EC 6.3.3.1)